MGALFRMAHSPPVTSLSPHSYGSRVVRYSLRLPVRTFKAGLESSSTWVGWFFFFSVRVVTVATINVQDNGLTDYEQLAQKATEAADRFHTISEQIKQTEQAMKTNAVLKAATVQYAKTRPVFEQYKATKYSRKFLAEHEADLELYRAAQAEMRSLLGGAKLPKMDVLKEEGRKLTAKKKQLYGEYQKARRDMQEIVTIKANIDTLMGYTEPGRKQEKER